MTWTSGVRALAAAVAIVAAVDPAVRRERALPPGVWLRTPGGDLLSPGEPKPEQTPGAQLWAQLERDLPQGVSINTAARPDAIVVIGETLLPAMIPDAAPVSFVVPAAQEAARVRVVAVSTPRPVPPGWTATVTADVEGDSVTPGSATAVVLESHGVEIDRVEHRWSASSERFTARLGFTPPSAGTFALRVRTRTPPGTGSAGAAVPVQALAEARRFKILAFDPRPSWASAFARRALEGDAAFDVVSRVRASRGLEVRTGAVPITLSAATVNPYDLAFIGAPEELTDAEVSVLEGFARNRGGGVVLIADRRPSGAYTRLLGRSGSVEQLLQKPVKLTGADGNTIHGSEFTFLRTFPPGAQPLISLNGADGTKVPLLTWPLGAGRIVFSGLLDAWRYRADDDGTFDAFWRSLVGREALRAPRRLEVSVERSAEASADGLRVRAAVRPTEHVPAGDGISIPAVSARLVDERGHQDGIRLWPTAEPGVFEGRLALPAPGRYDVAVETESGSSVDVPYVVALGEAPARSNRAVEIARATGGVVTTDTNLTPLVERLRALPAGKERVPWHPMRSPWSAVAFAGLLAAEWAGRRRRGLR
jgi:hypothetical protein